jgi:hypothetical protein
MTKDELYKRLIKIEATPLKVKVEGRDNLRRELNQTEIKPEYELNEFDSFFEFEKDIGELESARVQLEKLGQLNNVSITKDIVEDSFLMIDEDPLLESKSGHEDSFFIFQESEDNNEHDNENKNHHQPEELPVADSINSTTIKEEDSNQINKPEEEIFVIEKDLSFKNCMFIKSDGICCKRQAPKDSDYCSVHRKVLLKQG